MHALVIGFGWVSFWLAFVILAFLTVIAVVFAAVFLFAALTEEMKLRPLAPAAPQRWGAFAVHSLRVVEAGQAAGFQRLGLYSDGEKGRKEGLVALLLSGDGQTLLWVQQRPRGCKLITAFDDDSGTWLISTDIAGVVDLSGLHDERMLSDVELPVLLAFHHERVAGRGESVLPFSPGSVVEEVCRHERHRVAGLVQRGLARYRTTEQDTWSYSRLGAVKVTLRTLSFLLKAKERMDLAKARSAATGSGSAGSANVHW